MLDKILKKINENIEKIIEIRRYLHKYPEVSFEEYKTAKYISEFYEGKGVDVKKNVGGNGIIVTIDSGKPGKVMGIRADFDALPIKEETELEFSSKNEGVMHACGHDVHTACLLGLADILISMKDELKGKIILIHQHAEEKSPGGAKGIIESGLLDEVDNFFGIHIMTSMDTGNVYYHKGDTQQGRSNFYVKFKGKGGHASMPELSNDAIVAASDFVMSLQTIISRRLSPFENGSITVGSFDGKGISNIICEEVKIEGDIRAMTDNTMDKIIDQIEKIAKGISKTYDMNVDIEFTRDYPVLHNDEVMTDLVIRAVENIGINIYDCGAQAPSEDFARYAKIKPSCFFYVGAKVKNMNTPHHNSKFIVDEKCIEIAIKSMASVVNEYVK